MMESLSLEVEQIVKDVRNFFRPKKEPNYTAIKGIRKHILDQKKKLRQLKIEYLEIFRTFLSMKKKKKIIISQ